MPSPKHKLPRRRCPYCLKLFRPTTRRQVYHNSVCRSADWRWKQYEKQTDAIRQGLIELSLDIDDLLENGDSA